jgi:hypothetical protein
MIVDNQPPGVAIYKTKGDYIDYVTLQVLPDGRLNKIPSLTLEYLNAYFEDHGEKLKTRWHLKNGYVIDIGGTAMNESFTDITMQEYAAYNTANNTGGWPNDLIKPRIIDNDPFTEFYYMFCLHCKTIEFSIGEINEMLENGTIEEHFTKLK